MKIYLLISIPNGSFDIPTDRERFYKDFEVVGAYADREIAESSIPENSMDHNYDIIEQEIDFTKKRKPSKITQVVQDYIDENGDCAGLHHDD